MKRDNQLSDYQKGLRRYRGLIQNADPFELAFGRDSFPWFSNIIHNMSEKSGYSVEQVAGVVAVLSPMIEWSHCLRTSWDFIRTNGNTKYRPGFGVKYKKAEKILLNNDLSAIRGPKVLSFWKAMIDPNCNEVVIDTHMISACNEVRSYTMDLRKYLKNPKMLLDITSAINQISMERQWINTRTQATIWIVWKRHTKGYGKQLSLWGNNGNKEDCNLPYLFKGFPL